MSDLTKVLPCTCNHPWQDEQYGIGMRVHNYSKKHEFYRCTVCRNEKPWRRDDVV
jgi:hypothetical protein